MSDYAMLLQHVAELEAAVAELEALVAKYMPAAEAVTAEVKKAVEQPVAPSDQAAVQGA